MMADFQRAEHFDFMEKFFPMDRQEKTDEQDDDQIEKSPTTPRAKAVISV